VGIGYAADLEAARQTIVDTIRHERGMMERIELKVAIVRRAGAQVQADLNSAHG
jgi:hypothetical protein